MYQALYRKYRPRTFDDVVGQPHITETLKRQVAAGRLSHAYLFTGTRGTGKTTCAKILARAVNCQDLKDGNPCNACPACLGIEDGSILDVLELDAASNNGVDQIRALRDEAAYTPAAVRKRVYIVDEVHMLSTPAFNALLKILEEPPAHLMFILATTELHKVPATIKSRCQQYAFKRILPSQIAQRLSDVAKQEQIDLTADGAALLARLADGGMRDALSLLDQCSGGNRAVDETAVLDTLGLAGTLQTAALMEQIARHDTAAALETLGKLYAGGKDIGSVLAELAALARDLLLRKTAPTGGTVLLTGGYDEGTMRALGKVFSASRLLQILTLLQETTAALPRSTSRRTDAELCLIRMCDERLDDSMTGLSARIARIEEQLARGIPTPAEKRAKESTVPVSAEADDVPPWEGPPLPEEPPEETEYVFDEQDTPAVPVWNAPEPAQPRAANRKPQSAPVRTAPAQTADAGDFWPSFAAGLRGKVSPALIPYLNNPAKVTGTWQNGTLTLWVDTEFTRSMLNKPAVKEELARSATARFGQTAKVGVVTGTPPTPETRQKQPEAPAPAAAPEESEQQNGALEDLLAFGAQFDNITIE